MKFDINAAREAGYSDDEIADYLAKENNFDLGGALKSGYSASEVVGFLSGGASAAPAPAPAVDTGDDMRRMLARNPEPKRPSRSMSDAAKDAGITLLKGAIGLPESFVGLADIAAQGRIGKFLEEQGYRPGEAKQILDSYLSEAQKAANREVQQAEGFGATVKAAIQNPSTIATAVGESLPQMLGGVGVARGVMRVAPKVAPLVAGAIGEGALGAGSAASQIRGESKDGLLTPEQSAAAIASGVGTAALGIAGGKVAQRFGFDDVETMLARGSSVGPAKSVADFTKRVAAAGFSEGVLEEMPQSAQEKLWENYALDKPLTEGVGAAAGMGLVTGAAMGAAGGGGGSIAGRLQSPERVAAQELSSALEGGQFTEQGVTQAVADRLRTESTTGQIRPEATVVNFTAPDSPTAQAGLTPITVPVPSGGPQAATAESLAEQTVLPTLDRPFNRATDQDLLARTEAAVAAGEDNNAVAQPTEQWFGRKGDGYATEADAMQAIAGRQRMFKGLDWKVEQMPNGKFRLAGYEQNVQVPTETSAAATTGGELPVARATVPAVEAAGVEPAAAPILQNRDRSTPTSVVQMQSIAAKPDYGRLGFSRDFANGAPVVAGGQVPAQQLGKQDVAVASDGRRIPVQYAVMEAQDVLPSNQVDGTPNADYATAVDRVRAIAGNGRVAGLKAAYAKGTAGNYVQELSADNLHGINPQVIAGMKQPVLVRVMPTSAINADIGDVSNTSGNLTLSPVEQARNDGQRVALDVLQFADDGSITSEAVRQFVRAMPQAEQGGLIDTNGQPTKQAVDRINAAVFSRAYGNDGLVRLYAQAQDPEARLLMSALAQAAPKMARLAGAGALDIRGLVTEAVEIAVNARRNGVPLQRAAQQLDMTADPDVAVLLDLFVRNSRSSKKVAEALMRAADFAYSEANKSDVDMFGEVPKAPRSEVIKQFEVQDEQTSQATLEDAAGGFFAGQDAVGRGSDGKGAPASDQAQAGRAGQAQGLTDGTQTPQTIQSQAQGQEVLAASAKQPGELSLPQGPLPDAVLAELSRNPGAANTRASVQGHLNNLVASGLMPAAPKLGTPDADSEATVNVLGNLFGDTTGIGSRVVAYSNPGGENGFSMRGFAFVNTAPDTDVAAPRTTLHEIRHVVERLAQADTKAGLTNTPAQQFTASIDSIFDDMTDAGKRAYVENFLHKEELDAITDPAKREAAVQKFMASPLLRSEMGADFLGNRAQDRAFLIDLAKADPKGFEGFVQKWLAVIDNLLAKLKGSKTQDRKESAKVDQYVRDLNKAKMVARDALIAFRKGNLAEMEVEQEQVQDQTVVASQRQAGVDPKPAPAADVRKAKAYEAENGILPYTSAGQIEVPIGVEVGPVLFSIKQEGKYGNHPLFDIPVNKNGTVTLYYPATNEEARRVAKEKTLRAAPGSNRIYLTNESSAPQVMASPGNIEQALEGANVLVQVDPSLLQLDMEHSDGRKDFFIPLAEGKEFFRKMRMTRLFTQNAPRTKALTKDTKLTDLERRITDGVQKYLGLTKGEQRVRLKEAKLLLKREHNVTTLLGVNGKLEKTNTGGYGLNNYEGKDVKSMGLGLASAQKINENNLSTCPKSAICESLCLGETSGQNLLYGGDGQFKSGPRLSQYLKTEAMVVHPEEFAVVLHSEIAKLQRDAKKEDYQATVRLNVTSDFRPQTFKGIIEAFPDVMFYDYTKLPSKAIADNHHLTYSSTGASQVVNGKTIVNPESNWNKMVEVMRRGDNVAMAFSDKNTMPAYVVDEKSGERFQVWNGDNYDARFLDPKPGQEGNEFGKGMIIGLTNKDRTGKPEQAAEKNRGFFIDYNPERDGDTVVIKNQDFLAANTKFVPINVQRRAEAAEDVPSFSAREGETIDVGGIDLPLNDDGTVTLYHHTSKESAKLIRQSGILRAKAEPDVYMTTRRETDTGYGDTAVALRVPPDRLMLDDEFPDGRADFRMDVGRPGGSIRVKVEPDAGDIMFSRRQTETIDVDGVQRPTTNSNGQPIHSTEDGIRNFWRWFGDSKVVDTDGRPQVVYHVSRNGSPNVFKTEGNVASGFTLDASFFASDRLYAEEYAKVIGSSQYDIGEFYLASNNPLVRQMSPREFSDPPVEAKAIKQARRGGNDAVQFLGDQEYGEAFWAVFNPNQIKSATDNTGSFDATNPDIRFSARQAQVDQDPELITIFEGLQNGRGLKAVRAKEAAAEHPLGDAIQKVHNDFYDILERLDNAGLIEINC